METSDPFRQFFLTTIQDIICQDPGEASLLQLLKTVSPSLTKEQIVDSVDRNKAFRVLKSRIHPDKHQNFPTATKIFQEVQEFFISCCQRIDVANKVVSSSSTFEKNKKRKSATDRDDLEKCVPCPSSPYPTSYTVFKNWSYITTDAPIRKDDRIIPSEHLSAVNAFRCLNARGAVAHGKKISRGFTYEDVMIYSSSEVTKRVHIDDDSVVHSVFNQFGGGTKQLTSISQIKEELMQHGPVISLSFTLSKEYLDVLNTMKQPDSHQFLVEKVGCFHELLIIGWELTLYGQVWLCQPLIPVTSEDSALSFDSADSFIRISMGHFGIDHLCVAPKRDRLDHICWQEGPYFDVDFKDSPDWREWGELELPLLDNELKTMFSTFFQDGFSRACSERHPIVLRDKNTLAHSETFIATDLKWSDKTNEWFMTLVLKT